MNYKRYAVAIVILMMAKSALSQNPLPYDSQPFGGRETACSDGMEIKTQKEFAAPAGMYFVSVFATEAEKTKSYAGGMIGCHEIGRRMANMTRTVKGVATTVSVPVAVTIFAHADCGSGVLNNMSPDKRITAYCKVTGQIAPLVQ